MTKRARRPKPDLGTSKKLRGWIALPQGYVDAGICPTDIGNACRESLCGDTRDELLSAIKAYGLPGTTYVIIKLEGLVTPRGRVIR